jgi:hypothetical protein
MRMGSEWNWLKASCCILLAESVGNGIFHAGKDDDDTAILS